MPRPQPESAIKVSFAETFFSFFFPPSMGGDTGLIQIRNAEHFSGLRIRLCLVGRIQIASNFCLLFFLNAGTDLHESLPVIGIIVVLNIINHVIALREKSALRRRQIRNLRPAAFFVLPGFVLACVFVLYPMFFNIRISFSNYQIVQRTMTFTGLDNFIALFTERGDRIFLAIRNNFLYAIVTTPFIILFGLVFAVMVNSLKRGGVFFRTCFYLPVITSWVIVGNVFAYMFNAGQAGLINYLLKDIVGFPTAWTDNGTFCDFTHQHLFADNMCR